MNTVRKSPYNALRMPSPLIPLPAILLGVLAMIHAGVSPLFWGSQIAIWAICFLLSKPLSRALHSASSSVWSVLFLAILASTLLFKPVGNARRWIDLGIISVNGAMLVLPALILLLDRIEYPFALLIAGASILSFQPDLCQLIAFAAASIPFLWQRRNRRIAVSGSVLALAALIIRCLRTPITLEPVNYCEGILAMLSSLSPLLAAAGVLSLIAIPMYFVCLFGQSKQAVPLALALYYVMTLLTICTGVAPVPFMGYGLSPIVGYFLCCALTAPHRQIPSSAAQAK